MNMELLNTNYVNTSSVITVDVNTAAATKLFDKRPERQWKSVGYAGNTVTTITFDLVQTATIDRLIIQNTNLKDFTIYCNGATANTLTLTTTCGTTTSDWTGNSATSLYLYFTGVAMTSLSIQMSTTTDSGEKAIGQVIVGEQLYRFTRNPPASGYRPDSRAQEVDHRMSDGGSVTYHIRNKFSARINLERYADWEALKAVYDSNKTVYFAPFATGTSWDGEIFETNWTGGFHPLAYADDYTGNGRTVELSLKETAS